MISDGLACFAAVADAGCANLPKVVGEQRPRDLPGFNRVITMLGNLNTTLSGAYHALKYRKYGGFYFAAFAYRFNQRFGPWLARQPLRERGADQRHD